MTHDLKGQERARLQPKLQMIKNGDRTVNAQRAAYVAGLCIAPNKLKTLKLPSRMAALTSGVKPTAASQVREKLKSVPNEVEANVFIQLAHSDVKLQGVKEMSRSGRVVRATVRLSDLANLARQPEVAFVEIGESLKQPRVKRSRTTAEPKLPDRAFGNPADHKFGESVARIQMRMDRGRHRLPATIRID